MNEAFIPEGGRYSLGSHHPERKTVQVPKGFIAIDPGPFVACRRSRDGDVLTPADVAARWGVAHDKVLEFIKTGELAAFNVASKRSSRPQYRINESAIAAFEERRSGRDPARSVPLPKTRRRPSKASLPKAKKYF